jgi:TorA maturation chaperone TorD
MPVPLREPYARSYSILSRVSAGRSEIYRWLALGFYPPDAALVQAMNSGSLVVRLHEALAWLGVDGGRLASWVRQFGACQIWELEDLGSAWDSLFGTGLDRVTARESAYRWRQGMPFLDAAADLNRSLELFYARFGVKARGTENDHAAVELEFLAFLASRESRDWAFGQAESARELRYQEKVFLDDHPARWLPEFCARILKRDTHSFYLTLASLCREWLRLEIGPGYLPRTG